MFFPGSRYYNAGTYTVALPDGKTASVTRLPLPLSNSVIGYHRRQVGQRLDLIASHYLADPTTVWRLCDANNAVVPDALAAHDLVGIPARGN